jgi:hypothetical protein
MTIASMMASSVVEGWSKRVEFLESATLGSVVPHVIHVLVVTFNHHRSTAELHCDSATHSP